MHSLSQPLAGSRSVWRRRARPMSEEPCHAIPIDAGWLARLGWSPRLPLDESRPRPPQARRGQSSEACCSTRLRGQEGGPWIVGWLGHVAGDWAPWTLTGGSRGESKGFAVCCLPPGGRDEPACQIQKWLAGSRSNEAWRLPCLDSPHHGLGTWSRRREVGNEQATRTPFAARHLGLGNTGDGPKRRPACQGAR